MNTGTQLTGIERVLLEENVANRRKPRMYASFEFGHDEHPYPLDFNGLVEAINATRVHLFETW